MSASVNPVDISSARRAAFPETTGGYGVGPVEAMRRRLVDAQVEVLRMYLEKRSNDQLLRALDALIECTHASFREEETLMEALAPHLDPGHRAMHDQVLAQLTDLRNHVKDFDRGRLLAHLIVVDRQLTSHISDATRVSCGSPSEYGAEDDVINGKVTANQH